MIGSQNLFSLIKKRDKSIEEVAAIVAKVIPFMSEEDLRSFANYLEEEVKKDNKFKTYWMEILDLAYHDPAFRNRFEGDNPSVRDTAHAQADKFVHRIHLFIKELKETLLKKR